MSSQLWLRMAGYRNYIMYAGQKMNNLMWIRMAVYQNYITYAGQKLNIKLRMAGYIKYISYRYIFISSFVSLTKYAGQKLNTLMWLCIAGDLISIIYSGTI